MAPEVPSISRINKSDESPSESLQNVTNTLPKESPLKLFSISCPKVEMLSTISRNLETDSEWTDLKEMLGHNFLIFPIKKRKKNSHLSVMLTAQNQGPPIITFPPENALNSQITARKMQETKMSRIESLLNLPLKW